MELDSRELIGLEFERRRKRNPHYSLRAFAKTMGVSHSLLSLILSGKRDVSKKLWKAVSEECGFTSQPKSAAQTHFDQISLDTFAVIADWQHYAILNLMEISVPALNERIISERLGISRAEAGISLLRLKRLGLISKVNGRWKRCAKSIKVENEHSTAATRKHHRQVLEKALDSLESDPFAIRDFSSITLAIDPANIPYARQRIREFRRELMQEIEAMGVRKEVYHLAVQIYPVSKERKKP